MLAPNTNWTINIGFSVSMVKRNANQLSWAISADWVICQFVWTLVLISRLCDALQDLFQWLAEPPYVILYIPYYIAQWNTLISCINPNLYSEHPDVYFVIMTRWLHYPLLNYSSCHDNNISNLWKLLEEWLEFMHK